MTHRPSDGTAPQGVRELDRKMVGSHVALGLGVRHRAFIGLRGVITKAIISRGLYVVKLEDGRSYEAAPSNVVRIKE